MPGALSAASRVADATGARLAWIPRRAGERGALDAGALPTLLPGGRPVASAEARVDVAAAWGVEHVPWRPGRDTSGMIAALADGRLAGALVAGVDPADLPDPAAALAALTVAPFVVSLEVRAGEITALADVVLPVAPVVEKSGTFVNWEGRQRPFPAVLADTGAMPDVRVLAALADELDVRLGLPTVDAARSEFAELGHWDGTPAAAPTTAAADPAHPGPGEAVLATWRLLLDAGRLQDGEPLPGRYRTTAGRAAVGCHRRARSASGTAGCSRSVRSTGRSPCHWRSPRCRTGWCGCRRTRRDARSISISVRAPGRS